MCCCNQQLGAITGAPVHVGAAFALSVEFSEWWADTSFQDLETILDQIKSRLVQSGYVTGLVKAYQIAGTFNPYVAIEGYSGREYGSDAHLRDAVLSVVSSVYPSIDYGSVNFEVETYDPTTGAAGVVRYNAQTGGAAGGAGAQINNSLDRLATYLGVSRTEAALIGAGGALLGVLLLKRLL